MLPLCISLSILVITHLGILKGSRYIHILLYSLFNSIFQWNINIVINDYSDHVVTTAQHLPNQSSVLMRIWLGILCFNTVNQWEIMTQSSCKARGNRIINSKKSVRAIIFNPTCVFIHNLSMTMTWFTYFQIFQQFSKFTCYVSLHTYLWLLVSK